LNLLGAIGDSGLPADVISRQNAELASLDVSEVQAIASTYLDTDRVIVVVVGDAAARAKRLDALG
jgi:zinc protease